MTPSLLLLLAALPSLPATPKQPVVDEYWGDQVSDDYRWLEAGDAPEVVAWDEAQHARTRAFLDALPGRAALERHVTELLTFEAPTWFGVEERGGVYFARKVQPPKAQPFIVVLQSPLTLEGERVLLDPAVVDPSGDTTMDFAVPSLDGKYLAVSLSKKGTERGDVHVYEVATGKERPGDVVPAVNTGTAGGSLAWTADGFFYTRHPLEGERPKEDLGFYQRVSFHKLGTATKADASVLGQDFLRIAENFLSTTRDGVWAADLVQKGDGGEYELFVRSPDGAWTRVATYEDKVVQAAFGRDGALYLVSKKAAPRGAVLRLPLVAGKLTLAEAKLLVPQSDGAITALEPTKSRLYVVEQVGGPSRVRVFDLSGKPLGELPAPPVTSVPGVQGVGEGDDVLVYLSGYLTPLSLALYRAADGTLVPTPLAAKTPADLSPYEVVREVCTSKDGTKVPLNIVRKKGLALHGQHPTLLSGYGGYGVSLEPGFQRALPVWLEQGGVYALANLRGGGEFGEDWHQQGMLTKKQNVFDDFLACAQVLVAKKYTSPKKLAIQGGSNGGLLMGAALTQAPQAFRAVVSQVGIYDMLRVETTPNGAFNTTEFGTVKDQAQYQALKAYSPLHRVKDGAQYPTVLLTTGRNDPRVDAWQSRKMAARLQASGTKAPVLLRVSSFGHGMGTPLKERIAETVDVYSFLFGALGVKGTTAAKPR